MRKLMVEQAHPQLSLRRQSCLLGINRNRLKPSKPRALSEGDQVVARRMDELALEYPEFGARRMARVVSREGIPLSRKRAGRIMKAMGLAAVYRRPRTSKPAPGHKIYPYLLRGRVVSEPDEVWCADITYIAMAKGYAYLTAVMDWNSRAVLGWKLSNTMDAGFCVEALKMAEQQAGARPKIFNTDQGSQFTGDQWIGALKEMGIAISMDGKGRWLDNVFVERLWRAVKHEGIYLWAHDDLHQLEQALAWWLDRYNRFKPHSSLGGKTPWEVYRPHQQTAWRMAA